MLADSLKSKVRHQQNLKAPQEMKTYIGRGDVFKEKDRQRRTLRYSSLEPSGLYAQKGDVLTVAQGMQDSLSITIGSPERENQKQYPLTKGITTITVENEGPIYVTNPNDSGEATITISGATGSMPYFDLNQTSVADFEKQMAEMTNAKDVQLVSNKALITVSYAMAKKYLGDPKELMTYYDRFLTAQDRVSGITTDGNLVNFVDRHLQHFLESPKLYMYTENEFMGFHNDRALQRLLKTNEGWGIWHESGHQRQQTPWKWGAVVESSVNIYALAAQKELTGKITSLDQYYPEMHTYLKSDNKQFNAQNNNLKMVMFGQLGNTFGDNFYPVLHQYYRENKLAFGPDNERMQNFVLNVSRITGYNMQPYFEQWGFDISAAVKAEISQLAPLPEAIWLNDKETNKQLPMRLIDTVSLNDHGIQVNLTDYQTDVFKDEQLILKKNGQVISKLVNKEPIESMLTNNVWETIEMLKPTDVITIEQQNKNGTFK